MSGKYLKKKKKSSHLILLIAILLVVCAIIVGTVIGVGRLQSDGKGGQSAANKQGTNENADTLGDNAAEYITISTDYGDLYYPEQWSDYLVTEQRWDGALLTVSFSARINEDEYPMFQVDIGDGDGVEVGELTDGSGKKRTVYMSVAEIEENDRLTENEQRRLYAMQEDLNYLIDNLK